MSQCTIGCCCSLPFLPPQTRMSPKSPHRTSLCRDDICDTPRSIKAQGVKQRRNRKSRRVCTSVKELLVWWLNAIEEILESLFWLLGKPFCGECSRNITLTPFVSLWLRQSPGQYHGNGQEGGLWSHFWQVWVLLVSLVISVKYLSWGTPCCEVDFSVLDHLEMTQHQLTAHSLKRDPDPEALSQYSQIPDPP